MFSSMEFSWQPHLTTLLQGFDLDLPDSVAVRAFTPVPVQFKSAEYRVLRRADFLRDQFRTRKPGQRPHQVQWSTDTATYSCQEWALSVPVDDQTRANNNWLGLFGVPTLDEMNALLLGRQAQIRRDRFWAINFFKAGVWSTDLAGVATGPTGPQFLQFNQGGMDMLGFLDDTRDAFTLATGNELNVAVMGAKTWRKVRRHTQLIGTLGANAPKILNVDQVRGILELDDIILPRSIYNASDEGQTKNYQWIVPDDGMLLLHRAQNTTTDGTQATAGCVWGWTGLLPGQTNNDGCVIGMQRDPFSFSDHVVGRVAFGMSVTSPDLGVMLSTAVA